MQFDADQWRRLEDARLKMRQYFDTEYYCPVDTLAKHNGRRIFICFMRSAHITMSRLMEAYKRMGKVMTDVYIIALPYGDEIACAGSKADLEIAFSNGRSDATRELLSIEKHIEVRCYFYILVLWV